MLKLLVVAAVIGLCALAGAMLGTDGWWFTAIGITVLVAGTLALEAISRYSR